MWFNHVNETTVSAIQLIANIIQHVYPVMSCVYYFGTRTELLDQVFHEIGMPIVLLPKMCIPSGYILVESDNFEEFRSYPFYNKINLRILIVNQNIDKNYNFQRNCARYKSFDYVNGLHVYLLNIQMHNNDIISVDLYAIRDCLKLTDDILEDRLKIRTTRWRPAPELIIDVSALQFMPFVKCNEDKLIDGIESFVLELALPDAEYNLKCYYDEQLSYVEADVMQNKVDIGLGGSWDIRGIQLGVDFSIPLFQTCASMLVPKPKLLPMATFAFQPLYLNMWLMIICVVIVVSLLYKWFEGLPFIRAFLEVYKTLFICTKPRLTHASSSIIYATWLMTTVLLVTAISAGFTMILTKPRFTTPIRTYQDVYEQELECYEAEQNIHDILKSSPDHFLPKIADRMVYTANITDSEKVCYFCDILPARYAIPIAKLDDYEKQNLMVLPKCFGEFKFVIYFKKDSPLKRLFDEVIRQAREHGLMLAKYAQIRAHDVHAAKQADLYNSMYAFHLSESNKSLELDELQGAFYALCIGCFIGTLVFISEIVNWRQFNKNSLGFIKSKFGSFIK